MWDCPFYFVKRMSPALLGLHVKPPFTNQGVRDLISSLYPSPDSDDGKYDSQPLTSTAGGDGSDGGSERAISLSRECGDGVDSLDSTRSSTPDSMPSLMSVYSSVDSWDEYFGDEEDNAEEGEAEVKDGEVEEDGEGEEMADEPDTTPDAPRSRYRSPTLYPFEEIANLVRKRKRGMGYDDDESDGDSGYDTDVIEATVALMEAKRLRCFAFYALGGTLALALFVCRINGYMAIHLFDTAATSQFISRRAALLCKADIIAIPTQIVKGAGQIKTSAIASFSLHIGDLVERCVAYVVDVDREWDLILGNPWLARHKVTPNWDEQSTHTFIDPRSHATYTISPINVTAMRAALAGEQATLEGTLRQRAAKANDNGLAVFL